MFLLILYTTLGSYQFVGTIDNLPNEQACQIVGRSFVPVSKFVCVKKGQ